MERYVEQLIDDIHKATWNVKPPHPLWEESEADPDDEVELEDMSYVEKYIYGKKQKISKITGISARLLPPAGKLTSEQKALLATELEKLLSLFHFTLEFPESYPADLRYPFIVNFWKEKHVPLSFGEDPIELCDGVEDNCPFPGYCTFCKEFEAQMKFDEASWDRNGDFSKENPFNIEDLNGFFDDFGHKIDADSVPVPFLCKICSKYKIDDCEENMLCMLNRSDQRDNPDFNCGAFDEL